jgi:hypothetical protein
LTVSEEEQHRLLDESLIIPDSKSVDFNSEVWKKDFKSRRNMLFDLFHKEAIKNRKLLQELLGPPDEVKDEGKYVTWVYELGLQNGHYTFLYVGFESGRPSSMRVVQRYLGREPQQLPGWTVKNQDWEGLAEEYNRRFFLVGIPVSIINHWWTKTEAKEIAESDGRSEKVEVCEPFQFQYAADRSKVKRFRMVYETAAGKKGITKWQEHDLRKDPRCLVTMRDYQDRHPAFFESRFDSAAWKGVETGQFRRVSRGWMVDSLCRSYPLVGMSREEAAKLLGKGNVHQCTITEQENDPYMRDVEYYQLTFPWCGNAGYSILQLSYRQNRIAAYRVVNPRGMGGSGSDAGPFFNIDEK